MEMWIKIAEMGIAVCIFAGFGGWLPGWNPVGRVINAYDNICMLLKKYSGPIWSYDRWDSFLRKNGAKYHLGKWITPFSFLGISFLAGLLGLFFGAYMGGIAAVIMAAAGIFLPGIYIEYANGKDNREMFTELDLIYCALGIQIRAGVYVTDALAECYGRVSQVRLREGLEMLSGDIVMKADLDDALERFQGSFNNRYIDTLCITILQAMESGQAVELLGDIGEQIKEMELLMQSRKKEQLDRRVTFYQLGIFALVLVLTLYACITHLFETSFFFG
ncbi:MAG: type II secretion system F family protein [Lachnospiraceae bacterium]|nr:type II secretion system F family protein [Lachnospiraceae bacterium]